MTPRVRVMAFERTDGKPLTFLAGQWVSVRMPFPDAKGRPLRRSYSIASGPVQDSGRFELLITNVEGGVASPFLHQLSVGDELAMRGPHGNFLRLETAPSLFIATGTGVAPFRGMIAEALARKENSPLTLLLGLRHEEDILYREELEALAKAHPTLRVVCSLSRASASWTGRRGYVQEHVVEHWRELAKHGEPHAYICGVLKMLEQVRDLLKNELQIPRTQIHAESYG